MRRVSAGEGSAIPNTTFTGQPLKVKSESFQILKQEEHPSEVKDLHKGLSIATTAAEELGLDDMAAEIVQMQSEVEEEFPGSEDAYYGRGSEPESPPMPTDDEEVLGLE